jgi:hypothetical protein
MAMKVMNLKQMAMTWSGFKTVSAAEITHDYKNWTRYQCDHERYKRILLEAVVAHLKVLSYHWPGWTAVTCKKAERSPPTTLTGCLLNANETHYVWLESWSTVICATYHNHNFVVVTIHPWIWTRHYGTTWTHFRI